MPIAAVRFETDVTPALDNAALKSLCCHNLAPIGFGLMQSTSTMAD